MTVLHDLAAGALRFLDPETAHGLTVQALKLGLGPRDNDVGDPALSVDVAGLTLDNCIGLAAGFDKNAEVTGAMLNAGFGFVECGAVTPLPQVGNPRPRLFRLSEDRAVINRMGFNNQGLDVVGARLARRRRHRFGAVGVNIGANKESADRIGDYVTVLERLWPVADYFTVNISSPNTPGLRDLQSRDALEELLARIAHARAAQPGPSKTVFLKVAPDLTDSDVETICSTVARHGLSGVIVTNTTLSRPAGLKSRHRSQAGGLSGAPLADLAIQTLRRFHDCHRGHLGVIGVGGIASGADAYARIRAGACAVQLYTAMIYQGPGLIARMKKDLAARLRADGFTCVGEAVGTL